MAEYRIDDLARAAGTSVRNVRVYQDRDLLAPPVRRGRTAIYGDTTLSGAAAYARVVSADGPRTVSMAGTDYVGLAVTVEVVS